MPYVCILTYQLKMMFSSDLRRSSTFLAMVYREKKTGSQTTSHSIQKPKHWIM